MAIKYIALILTLQTIYGEVIREIQEDDKDGYKNLGYKVVYGDEDMTILNEVVQKHEKTLALKPVVRLNEAIKPLPAHDVKCLMSVDRYCSKNMAKTKSILIQTIKDDCKSCSDDQKEEAGRVVAAMMAHDPVAWKLFLTRYDGLKRVERILG